LRTDVADEVGIGHLAVLGDLSFVYEKESAGTGDLFGRGAISAETMF
jgi:hypothetical protein